MSGRPIGGLWRRRDFGLFWLGETTSKLGTSVAELALPLIAVLTLHAGTFELGVLQAAAWCPWLLIGLSAGAWVDRLSPRPLMIVCDAIALLLLVSVPVAAWVGVLTTAQLLIVALLVGVASVFFTTAYTVFLPDLLPAADLPEGNAKLQGSESVAQIAGPGLSGLLAQAFGAVTGLLADAASCLVSLVCLLAVRPARSHERTRKPGSKLHREIAEGARFVAHDPYLRVVVVVASLANLFLTAFETVQVPLLINQLHLSAGAVGGLLAITGIGGVLGAAVAGKVVRALGSARGWLVCATTAAVFGLLIPFTGPGAGVVLFVVGDFVMIGGLVAGNVIFGPFEQRYSPPRLLGRVVASTRFCTYGAIPVGGLLGGTLGTVLGIHATLWITMIGFALTTVILYFSPIGRTRDLPTGPAVTDLSPSQGSDVR